MAIHLFILLMGMVVAPQVEVTTLDGERYSGQIERLDSETLTLGMGDDAHQIATAELMKVHVSNSGAPLPNAPQDAQIALVDGSLISCTAFHTRRRTLSLETAHLGKLAFRLKSLRHVRLAPIDANVEEQWNQLCGRQLKRDLLVIRKNNVLDHLDGTIGNVDDNIVRFLYDGEEIEVNRQKVFGLIYARDNAATSSPFCRVSLGSTDTLEVSQVEWDGNHLSAKLLAGPRVELPMKDVRVLDFSLGKVRYLSDMEPRDVEYTPFFDVTWKYRRDRNLDGEPLRVGNKEYARGLAIHSKTFLRYRLDGEYRRFRTVMGIDDAVQQGDVHVIISGDAKPLFESDVRRDDRPRELDLDVTGIRDLEILVDFGAHLDISDHLDLADARVIK